jgi:hypothetical protein
MLPFTIHRVKELMRRFEYTLTTENPRVDYAMLLGRIFLLTAGAGTWSLDARADKGVRAPG